MSESLQVCWEFLSKPCYVSGLGSNLDDDDSERPKRGSHNIPIRIRAPVPVRRNGRELGLPSTGAGPILEGVEAAGGSGHSLQDLVQIRRAIQAWEAKLAWFANKFEHHPEALKTNPVWNKLMRIRNSLVQLAQAEEMRQSALDETRM